MAIGDGMTLLVRQNTYAAWLDGDVTDYEALRSLCSDYEEIEQSYKDFEKVRATTRDQMAHVMVKLGDKVEVKGFGTVLMTAPSVSVSYDRAKVKALIAEWSTDFPEFAEALASCETQSCRSGGLRIERVK
jgi:hypothetical protein